MGKLMFISIKDILSLLGCMIGDFDDVGIPSLC